MSHLVPCIDCYGLLTEAEYDEGDFSIVASLRESLGLATDGALSYDIGNIWISAKRERWLLDRGYKIFGSSKDEGLRHVVLPLTVRVTVVSPFYYRYCSWASSVRGIRKILGEGGLVNMYRVFFPDEVDRFRKLSLYMPMKGAERFSKVIQVMEGGKSISSFAGVTEDLLPGYYVYTDGGM